ncbi:MAG: DUF4328 domain-containing protein [Pyrinomonadaceae bacterium]|nr:DUF4328 domain-containing protein [Pyrinomonadaceae bacterium]
MYQDQSLPGYRSARNLSLFAIIALALNGVCNFVSSLLGIGQVLAPDMSLELDGGMASGWLLLQGLVYLMLGPIAIATIVGFLMWLYRAHSNLPALQAQHTSFTPGWAVGWWFIPFANLVKPFQAVREVWAESDPDIPQEMSFLSASLHSAPTYMGFWWAFWIISNIISNITSRVYNPDRMDELVVGGVLFTLSGITTAIAAVLAIKVVRDTTNRQEERSKNVRSVMNIQPPPPPTFYPEPAPGGWPQNG